MLSIIQYLLNHFQHKLNNVKAKCQQLTEMSSEKIDFVGKTYQFIIHIHLTKQNQLFKQILDLNYTNIYCIIVIIIHNQKILVITT